MKKYKVNIRPLHFWRSKEIFEQITNGALEYSNTYNRKPYIFMDEVTYSYLVGYYDGWYNIPTQKSIHRQLGCVHKWLGRYNIYIDNDIELGDIHFR